MFYIENENKIILFDDDKQKIQNTIDFLPQYEGLEIKETQDGYAIYDFELMTVEEKEAKEKQKERERLNKLTCTKRVFALMLQELGIDYLTQLKPLIESNPQAQLEWDLCVELLRENQMLDIMALQLGITAEQIDALFLYANGELSKDDFELYKPKQEVKDENTTDTTDIPNEVDT